MNNLVFIDNGKKNTEPYTTSEIMAEVTGIAHKKIKIAINKHKIPLESFGFA